MEWIGYGLAFAFGWYIMPIVITMIIFFLLAVGAIIVDFFNNRG